MWGFATDMRVQADCTTVLRQVAKIVRAKADDAFRKKVSARIDGWFAASVERKAAVARAAEDYGGASPAAPPGCVRLWAQPSRQTTSSSTKPYAAPLPCSARYPAANRTLTLFCGAGGGLGYSGGMALGNWPTPRNCAWCRWW